MAIHVSTPPFANPSARVCHGDEGAAFELLTNLYEGIYTVVDLDSCRAFAAVIADVGATLKVEPSLVNEVSVLFAGTGVDVVEHVDVPCCNEWCCSRGMTCILVEESASDESDESDDDSECFDETGLNAW